MKVYRHKTTKAIMSEHDYNHLSSYQQQQMEETNAVTFDELEQMSRDTSYWVSESKKQETKGEMNETTVNNNPGLTMDIFGANTETHTIATPSGQNNTGTYPEPGQIWSHYKGGRYEIVAMCNHTTTNELLVIYKSLSFNGFHARPYSEWHDEVWNGPHCVRRFELVCW
jgi:hypothetical protein